MSLQTSCLPAVDERSAFKHRVTTCYDFFDAVFPGCGLEDFTEGKYEGDLARGYEEAQCVQAEWLLDSVRCAKGSRILDVGCGNGRVLAAAMRRGAAAVGITISPPQVHRCRQRGLDVRLRDYRDMEREFYHQFDAIIANGSVEHFVRPDEVVAGRDDSVYEDFFQRCRQVLDPNSPCQRLATTVIHRHEQSPRFDPADLKKGPFAFRWGSTEFHYALLQRGFGGWYPELHQLERCAAPTFMLIDQEDGTQDYHITSEAWFQQVRRRLWHWKHGPGVWMRLGGQFFRHPRQTATLAICLFLAESWQWQFRGSVPPTRLLRQVWQVPRPQANHPTAQPREQAPSTLGVVS